MQYLMDSSREDFKIIRLVLNQLMVEVYGKCPFQRYLLMKTILKNFQSPFNATVVNLLIDSGAIILGKTNMDEFGMGSATIHSHYGKTRNPHRMHNLEGGDRVAGGSSGGSAASVASGMCFAA